MAENSILEFYFKYGRSGLLEKGDGCGGRVVPKKAAKRVTAMDFSSTTNVLISLVEHVKAGNWARSCLVLEIMSLVLPYRARLRIVQSSGFKGHRIWKRKVAFLHLLRDSDGHCPESQSMCML